MEKGLVLGFFDGVHLAHQNVIRSAVDKSQSVIVITFKDSPAKYFKKNIKYINSRKRSIEKIKALGVSKIVQLDFREIVNLTAEDYLEFITNKYTPTSITTGFNHTFGKNKTGNSNFLLKNSQKYKYKYYCIPALKEEGVTISSSYIRELLSQGNLHKANQMLGSNFQITGKVIEGNHIGRTIGFPTANIEYPEDIVQIPYGVYSAQIGQYKGILNWGIKPTIQGTNKPVVEVHILNFDKNIYGQDIEIDILERLRDEKKFASLKELKEQIKKDTEECLK